MKIIEPSITPVGFFLKFIVRFAVDPWAAMMAFGGLGHRLNIPFLLHLGFFESLLLIVIASALSPMTFTRWKMREPGVKEIV